MDATYMVEFMRCIDTLAASLKVAEPTEAHSRGEFAQIRIGWNHGMGEGKNVRVSHPLISVLRTELYYRCHIALLFIRSTNRT